MHRALAPLTAIAVLLALALGAPAGAISVPTTTTPHHTPTPAPTSAAAKLLAAAVHDAKSQKWVHETTYVNETGITDTTIVSTIGTGTISARVTTSGILGAGTYSVIDLLNTNREYVRGSASALSTIDHFIFTSEVAPSFAGKWIKLTPAITEGDTRVNGGTLTEQFSTLTTVGSARISSAKYDGRSVNTITSDTYGVDETIYISKGPKPLPLAYTVTTSGIIDSVAWSDWGHGSSPAAPAGAAALPTTTTPTTTPTTLPASAGFCPDVVTLNAAYTALVAAGSAKTATVAEYTASLSALATDLGGIITNLGSVITTAPTPDIAADYTVLLGYAQALSVTLSLINAAIAALPAGATMTDLDTAIVPFEIRALIDVSAIQFNKPTNEAASVFCPAPTTTSTTTTTTTTAPN
jgi:hypothetical protein